MPVTKEVCPQRREPAIREAISIEALPLSKTYINRNCPICGKLYSACVGRLKHGHHVTCGNRECVRASRSRSILAAKYKKKSRDEYYGDFCCSVCNKTYRQLLSKAAKKRVQVCSFSCYRKGLQENLEGFRFVHPRHPSVTYICETCSKQVEVPHSKIGGRRFRFCSGKCADIGNRGEKNVSWRGGYPNSYGSDWKAQRRAAWHRDNYTCQRCGITKAELGRNPDVHHIKPFKFCKNSKEANRLENLISLCHRCHIRVEHNGMDFQPKSMKLVA